MAPAGVKEQPHGGCARPRRNSLSRQNEGEEAMEEMANWDRELDSGEEAMQEMASSNEGGHARDGKQRIARRTIGKKPWEEKEEDEKATCRFFRNGWCKHGEKCRFAHQGEQKKWCHNKNDWWCYNCQRMVYKQHESCLCGRTEQNADPEC